MKINEKIIKSLSLKAFYERGLDYYLRNRVRKFEVNSLNDKKYNETITEISAEVMGISRDYNVYITIDENMNFKKTQCNCDSYTNYPGLCKHLVATLFKYVREGDKYDPDKKVFQSDTLIKQLSNKYNVISETEKLNIEIKYTYEGDNSYNHNLKISYLSFKVGTDRLYVLKDIREFLECAIYKNKKIEFGKNFTYDPNIYNFKEEDKPLIDLLYEIYDIDKAHDGMYYVNSNTNFIRGKFIYLTSSYAKKFFEIVAHRKISINILNNEINNINIIEDNIPLTFDLKYSTNNVVMEYSGAERPISLTDKWEYCFYNSNIYRLDDTQASVYRVMDENLHKSRTKNISFDESESEKIASYIIPALKDAGAVIKIDNNFAKKFYEETLKTTIYLDKNNDEISADIKFIYGEIEINPAKNEIRNDNDKILIRDVKKESNSLELLNFYRFEKDQERFIQKSDEKLIEFLTEGVDKLQEFAEVYYSESFKNINIYNSSYYKSGIRLNDNDLLEFSFKIEGVDNDELINVFKAIKEKKKYYKLKKGGFIPLESEEIQNISNMIEYLNIKESELKNESIVISKYNAMYIDQNIKLNDMNYIERNKKFKEMVNSIRDPHELDFDIPKDFEDVLRGYQKVGYKWFKILSYYGFGGILADEMGLGKTLQTIVFIANEIENDKENPKPCLVIAPTSLVYNWQNEIEKFAPNIKSLVVSGNRLERGQLINEINNHDVIITSYPLIRRDIEEYKDIDFKYCFLDEAQQIKNPSSQNAQSVKQLKAKAYFALTGTPMENSLTELWSIFDFLMPSYLLSHNKFMSRYENPIIKNKDKKALSELNKHIKPFILRRLKKDVMKELPPKIEHKMVAEMTEEQKKLYLAYLTIAKGEIKDEIEQKGFNKSKLKILSVITRLRQICCEPSIFTDSFSGESGKMLLLDDILEESINSGHRILLFSQFTSVLKKIQERLLKSNIEYMYLDGQTKAIDRGIMVKEFNEGRGSVFLISLKAGGTGLNLTGADVVIHFDPWWNPAVEDQASDRAHRIGQKKTVEVIKLISRGTIEEKIIELQKKKKEIIENVIEENDNQEEHLISKMSQEELSELFDIKGLG